MTKKLFKKLRREAKANPMKAVVLGVLFLVAIYFWAPLAGQWISNRKDQTQPSLPATSTARAPVAAPAPGSPTAGSAAVLPSAPVSGAMGQIGAATKPTRPWRELAEAIESDPLMRPAVPSMSQLARPNPFGRLQPAERVQASPEPKANERLSDRIRPSELGMVLSSTVVGRFRKTAVINGKVYTLGREVPAAAGVSFQLTDIQPRRIVLTRAGREFELRIARSDDVQ